MAKKKKKKKLIKRLKNQYRLTVLNETTYEEKFSTLLTPLNVLLFVILAFIVSGSIVYSVVALTPLKQYLVPDFTDYQYRQDATESRILVDSLLAENAIKDNYIERIKVILGGGVLPENLPDTLSGGAGESLLEYHVTKEDSLLRAKIEAESKYNLRISEEVVDPSVANLFLFKPLEGMLSASFDPDNGHYGIDIVAPENEVIKAVLSGTVTMAAYTAGGGHVIQIQHSHNLLSVYKHNSALFKKVGDLVTAGQSIAVIGNSGELSDGPHLHFELWLDGVPVNPLEFFAFEQVANQPEE
jgi:murein DD-endopeptidase MepM/ murein hydrolase activator NlpD